MEYLNAEGRLLLRWAEAGGGRLRVPSPEELARAEAETAEVEEEDALSTALARLELGGAESRDEPLFAAQTPREEVRRREAAAHAEPSEDSWDSVGPSSPRGSSLGGW